MSVSYESSLLNEPTVHHWIAQFKSPEDKALAQSLLANVMTVTANEFIEGMSNLLRQRLQLHNDTVGLFIESERLHRTSRRTNRREPNRLFKQSTGKRKRASGSGPAVVNTQNNPKKQVGSEGLIAQLATEIMREFGSRICINPGPDRIRKIGSPVRRFILLTDFIGSGDRVSAYLQSAWRVNSVRSWWSRRSVAGLSFEVVAYSATSKGLAYAQKHPCKPTVNVVSACPTIKERFKDLKDQARIIDLCQRYPVVAADDPVLGYGETGALIAFHHGIPNNTPGIFWMKTRTWKPLFKNRVTSNLRHTFSADKVAQEKSVDILGALGLQPQHAAVVKRLSSKLSNELLVAASIRLSPRTLFAISARSGLSLCDVCNILMDLEIRGLIDDSHRLTTTGKAWLSNIFVVRKSQNVPVTNFCPYYPTQLRAPVEPSECL